MLQHPNLQTCPESTSLDFSRLLLSLSRELKIRRRCAYTTADLVERGWGEVGVAMAGKLVRELLLGSYDDGDISEDEFLLLYDANSSKNPDFPHQNYEHFDLEELDESECLAEFRFQKRDIPVLAEAMRLPDSYTCEQGTVCDGIEGLCLLLRRLAYPCRYSDLIHRFGRPVPEICMITNHVMETVYSLNHHRLTAWNHTLMSPPLLQTYADAIRRKGSALPNSLGFVDGKTHLQTTRKPKSSLQRTQKSSRFEISICCIALWYDSQHVLTSS